MHQHFEETSCFLLQSKKYNYVFCHEHGLKGFVQTAATDVPVCEESHPTKPQSDIAAHESREIWQQRSDQWDAIALDRWVGWWRGGTENCRNVQN
jgi:hypothetical protein